MLRTLEDNSVDSLVTDPPAGISFMGKEWDHHKGGRKEWVAWLESVMRECLRVLKPGAHGLVWALPRTAHWTATALEDAGFEIRDCITHLFGSGFPKSHNIEKSTEGAVNGQGTALKPAAEFWWLVRKPCSEKTVAANVLKWGTGGLNIDGCRIQSGARPLRESVTNNRKDSWVYGDGTGTGSKAIGETTEGRFPANLVFSHSPNCTEDACDMFECAVKMLDEQSGHLKTGGDPRKTKQSSTGLYGMGSNIPSGPGFAGDSGGASRFFYCAKVSPSERNAGLEDIPDKERKPFEGSMRSLSDPRMQHEQNRLPQKNNHPTVKPQKLMRYLCKLVTPPGGTVLDPFMGSGSTGLAAKSEGFQFIGIEKEPEYFEIAKARIG